MRVLVRVVLSLLSLSLVAGVGLWFDQGIHLAVPGLTRPSQSARVVEIVSGDALDVNIDNVVTRLLIRGIDAPAPDQCLGPEARDRLRDVTPIGRRVALRDVERAEDGSLTATVHTVLTEAGRAMAADGLAVPSAEALAVAEATGGDPGIAADELGEEAGFTERYEARQSAADLLAAVTRNAEAKRGAVGLYDPTVPCTVEGQIARAQKAVSEAAGPLPATPEQLDAFDAEGRYAAVAAARGAVAELAAFLAGDERAFPLRAYTAAELAEFRERPAQFSVQLDDADAGTDRALADRAALHEQRAAEEAEKRARADEARAAEEERRNPPRLAPGAGGAPMGSGAPDGSGASTGTGGASGGAPTPPPAPEWVQPGDPAGDTSGIAGLAYDGYEGCRAYSGFPPDAVDEMGRPFRKVDCMTRQPLTPVR